MKQNSVILSFGRHQSYGYDTEIERESMLAAYYIGTILQQILPQCETVYYSPVARASVTARFEALGMKCSHLIETHFLEESSVKYAVQNFINELIKNTSDEVFYYHFVTHLPVIEKLGLPFLGQGDVCLLIADSWTEVLAKNYNIQVIKAHKTPLYLWQKLSLNEQSIGKLNTDEIYAKLCNLTD